MLRTLQIVYDKFYLDYNFKPSVCDTLKTDQVLRFLAEKSKIDPSNTIYNELIKKIINLKTKEIDPIFVERFCISKLSEKILQIYPVNIAEAFVLGYVLLNTTIAANLVYFKLGNSGLLAPTVIDGVRITDIEAVSQFLIKSLSDAELISLNDNRCVTIGKKFSVDFGGF